MELIIIIAIIAIIVVEFMMRCNIKELEKIATNEELNKIAEKYPDNKTICKEILKKLNNENTQIEEDEKSNATLYLAMPNKISIGNTRGSYTRIQTMAHECLHSIQDKKMLIFNFIYSNIYLYAASFSSGRMPPSPLHIAVPTAALPFAIAIFVSLESAPNDICEM